MNNKVILGQIGVGYWGPNIIRNLHENKRCTIKTVVDLDEKKLSETKLSYNYLNVSKNINKIFEDDNISAVMIVTPVETHYDLAMRALKAGKHIFVEKPMAKSVAEVDNIIHLAKKNNLIAMVGHTFLYNPAIRLIKKLIDSDDFGDLKYIICERTNLGKARTDVDALWNLAPHDISIVQYLLNDIEPKNVQKNGMSFLLKGIDDVSFMNIEYENGIHAYIHVSWLDPIKARKIKIIGSKQMIVFDDTKKEKIKIANKSIKVVKDNSNNISFDYIDEEFISKPLVLKEPLSIEVDHFIDCILNGKNCLTDAEHAKKVIKILSVMN